MNIFDLAVLAMLVAVAGSGIAFTLFWTVHAFSVQSDVRPVETSAVEKHVWSPKSLVKLSKGAERE